VGCYSSIERWDQHVITALSEIFPTEELEANIFKNTPRTAYHGEYMKKMLPKRYKSEWKDHWVALSIAGLLAIVLLLSVVMLYPPQG
jgi:hypothetical protein